MKRALVVWLLLAAGSRCFSGETYRDALPPWLARLRDAVYEQVLRAEQIYPLYTAAKTKAGELSGADKFNALAFCEYLMGRAYQYFELKDSAVACYQRGYDAAESSLAVKETAAGWVARSNNLSQLCTLKPRTFAISRGLDVGRYAENALKLNPRSGAAKHIIASRWVYAPAPFNDNGKGVNQMKEILAGDYELQRDDLFNVYTALAYVYLRIKDKNEARVWIDKALSVYPTNKFVGEELRGRL
ncbi:MAG: hypothetical protein LBG84_02820 [Treponema sp.]|nr:hypothetical protein [Treponema sp.]